MDQGAKVAPLLKPEDTRKTHSIPAIIPPRVRAGEKIITSESGGGQEKGLLLGIFASIVFRGGLERDLY